MRYAGMIKNDIAAGKKVNVTFFVQGCPIHCKGCHNPETWDFDGGYEFTPDTLDELFRALEANGVERNLSIMGGEPMAEQNLLLTAMIVTETKKRFPNIEIYLWSGYTYKQLLDRSLANHQIKYILNNIDVLIAGPYMERERDITLPMMGSRNQQVIYLKEKTEE